jgi:hypothetical protein
MVKRSVLPGVHNRALAGVRLRLILFGGQKTTHGSAADVEKTGDLGFADAGTMWFTDRTGQLSDSYRPTKVLALPLRLSDTGADTFAEILVFEGRELREQYSHGAARRRRQIESFSKGHEGYTATPSSASSFKVVTRSTSERSHRSSRQTSTTSISRRRAGARRRSRSSRSAAPDPTSLI